MAFPYWKCEKCGSTDVQLVKKVSDSFGTVKCQKCGHEWEDALY